MVKKQIYTLKLFKKWKIYNVFDMSLLKQNNIKKGWTDYIISKLEFNKGSNGKQYTVEKICNNAIYTKKSEGYLLGKYYLVL